MNEFTNKTILHYLNNNCYCVAELIYFFDKDVEDNFYFLKLKLRDNYLYLGIRKHSDDISLVIEALTERIDNYLSMGNNTNNNLSIIQSFIKTQIINKLSFDKKVANIYQHYSRVSIDEFSYDLAKRYTSRDLFLKDLDDIVSHSKIKRIY